MAIEGQSQATVTGREGSSGARLEQFWRDVRYGLRLLRKNPGFTAIAVLTLALGIGANSAIFSVLYGVLLKPLPYEKPGRLVRIWQTLRSANSLGLSQEQLVTLRNEKKSFSEIGGYTYIAVFVKGDTDSERVIAANVTSGTLEATGVQPFLGRSFSREDEVPGGPEVAILTYNIWQRRFQGSRDIINQNIIINDTPTAVIGVLPQGFVLPESFAGIPPAEVWLPLRMNVANPDYDRYSLRPIARLSPGVNVEKALAETRLTFSRMMESHGFGMKKLQESGWSVRVTSIQDDLVGDVRAAMWVLAGAVGVVLLIVCANVASLLLARASARQKEISVRVVLGAQPRRIIQQMLTESLTISLLGGVLGLGLAAISLKLIVSLGAGHVPRLAEVGLNFPVVAFTLVVCIFAALLFGLAPAFHAARPDLNQSLREEDRGSSSSGVKGRAQSLLVVAEVASAVVLVVSAGLLLRSFNRLLGIDPGFNVNSVLTVRLGLPPSRYTDATRINAFWRDLVARTKVLPGVTSASATSVLPLFGDGIDAGFEIQGRVTENRGAQHLYYWEVAPDYFKTMGIALQKGRYLEESDTASAPAVTVISESLARRFFPDESPLGKHIRVYTGATQQGDWAEIVGVVKNVAMRKLNEDPLPEAFFPVTQGQNIAGAAFASTLVLHTSADPKVVAGAVREQVRQVDSSVAVALIMTTQELVDETVSQPHFNLVLLAQFAGVALLLAAVGIYGILANMVRQRTREIGIRLALGAQPTDVMRLIVGQGMKLAAVGLVLGLAGALGTTRLLTNLLFGVKPTDPLTFAAVMALLVVVSMLACYVPARRAMRVDPMVTLRYE